MYKLLGKWNDEAHFEETNFKVYSSKADVIEYKASIMNSYLGDPSVYKISKTRLGGVVEFYIGLVKEYRIVKLK